MHYDRPLARTLLARTPATLRAQLIDLPAAWLDAPESPGAWSPSDVVGHMADLEDTAWLPRIHWILEHGTERALPSIAREAFRERYLGLPLTDVLDEFQAARARNLAALDALPLDDDTLRRAGAHPQLGEVRLSELLRTWVAHDLTHIAQVQRSLAAQLRDAVGPWQAFLSVMARRPGRE
ncbi:MAG: DinB family protein [Phycisphaerales bacterium JB038]